MFLGFAQRRKQLWVAVTCQHNVITLHYPIDFEKTGIKGFSVKDGVAKEFVGIGKLGLHL